MSQRDKGQSYASSKGPVNRLGQGLVSLGAPKRTKSSAKLAVPKPVNLPSLKKENAGNDPTTQLVPSGQSGWSAKADEHDHSLVERSTWASSEPARQQHQPQAAWQRTGALNPMDFPSLAASASGKPQQAARQLHDLPGQAGNWDEDERDYDVGPVHRSALIDREGSGREGPPSRYDQPGQGGGYREAREGRQHPAQLHYERGYYRDGGYGGSRDGGYGRDRPEQPYRDWDGGGYGREGPYGEEGRGGAYGRELYPGRYDRPHGGPRGMRHENGGGRWGSEPYRRYDEGYREEYGRGYSGDDGYDSRTHSRYERPPRPYAPVATDYDPDLFPPMPPSDAPTERRARSPREPDQEADQERQAFNAELERVAAELDKQRGPSQGEDGGRRSYAGGHSDSGSEAGEQVASYAERAAARRVEEEERSWHDSAHRKLWEAEDRMAYREEAAQRKARELADAQAAAHAALCKPPPRGAEPAFERRSTPMLERRAEPRMQAAMPPPVVPPPPPPPRPPVQSEPGPAPIVVQQPVAPAYDAAPPSPSPRPAQEVYMPVEQPVHQPAPQQPVQQQQPVQVERPRPAAPPAAPRSPKAGSKPQLQQQAGGRGQPQQQPAAQQPAAQQPPAAAPAPPPAAAPAPPPAAPPPPPPLKTSLVKPGASWRSVLSGVPDAPTPKSGPASDESAGQRGGAAAGKAAVRESKRAKGRAVRQAAAPAAVPAHPVSPRSAAAEGSAVAGKGKGRGKGSKAQKAAGAAGAGGQPAAGGAVVSEQQAAQGQRAGRRQREREQQQQQQREGTAGSSRSGRGTARARNKGKGGQGQAQLSDAGAAEGPGSAAELEDGAASIVPAAPSQPVEGMGALLAPGRMDLVEDAAAAAPSMAPPSSTAAFGWSSPLADEVAKLQLSAAASADAELAAEVEAAVAAAGVAELDRAHLPAMTLLDRDLLEPSPLQAAAAGLDLEPRSPTAPAGHEAGGHSAAAAAAVATAAVPSLDLLADDVITALPADLTLDLAGGGAGGASQPASAGAGLQAGPTPGAGYPLSSPQQAASPPPFPGGLFPIPSIAVGASNPWQHSPSLQEPSVSAPSLAAAAQSLYSLAQQPHYTFGTHTNIPIAGQPSSLASAQFGQQQAAAAAAFVQRGQVYGQAASFMAPPSAAFIPTGKQPDWSTPHGRSASPAPLSSYPTLPPQPTLQAQGADAVLPYNRAGSTGVYGRTLPGAMQLPMQYPQQQQQQQPSPPPLPQAFAQPQQQHQLYDPAAALPDDVFGEGGGHSSGGDGNLGPAAGQPSMNGGPGAPGMQRGPKQEPGRGRPRFDTGMPGMHPPPMAAQQQHMYMVMSGFPGGRGPAGYGSRGPVPPPGVQRHPHSVGMGGRGPGPAAPPPPPNAAMGGPGRGGRARAGRAGRSGRGPSGSGPQPPMKNMYVPKQHQQQQQGAPAGDEAAA